MISVKDLDEAWGKFLEKYGEDYGEDYEKFMDPKYWVTASLVIGDLQGWDGKTEAIWMDYFKMNVLKSIELDLECNILEYLDDSEDGAEL